MLSERVVDRSTVDDLRHFAVDGLYANVPTYFRDAAFLPVDDTGKPIDPRPGATDAATDYLLCNIFEGPFGRRCALLGVGDLTDNPPDWLASLREERSAAKKKSGEPLRLTTAAPGSKSSVRRVTVAA